jgi:hypothetical protein
MKGKYAPIHEMAFPTRAVEWLELVRIQEVQSLKFDAEIQSFSIHKLPYYSRLHNQRSRSSVVKKGRRINKNQLLYIYTLLSHRTHL